MHFFFILVFRFRNSLNIKLWIVSVACMCAMLFYALLSMQHEQCKRILLSFIFSLFFFFMFFFCLRWKMNELMTIDLLFSSNQFSTQLENGSLYISSVEENRGLTGAYQCLLTSDGIGTIVSRSAIVSISSKFIQHHHSSTSVYSDYYFFFYFSQF